MAQEDTFHNLEPISGDNFALPVDVPILPIKDIVFFPNMMLPLTINDGRFATLVDDSLSSDRIIGLVTIKETVEGSELTPDGLYNVGLVAMIHKMLKMPDGSQRLLIQGMGRIRTNEYTQTEPYFKAKVERLEDRMPEDGPETQALMMNVKGIFKKLLEMSPYLPSELGVIALNVEHPGNLADLVAANMNIKVPEKQDILETVVIKERLEKILSLLNKEMEILELGSKIQTQAKGQMDKLQREYFLREQLKAIRKELGETDDQNQELLELRVRIDDAELPEEAKAVAERELDRLARISPSAPEYSVARTYLDWLADLPWNKSTNDNLDIKRAQKILDEDHYDLEKVKKRIIEYLAVRKLKPDIKGPILCFVGPPGTGKTSLGRSIARAMGREFIRLSLGGVRDEAEIRGHRRTYVGALPGRIIHGLRKAGSNNPIFMLDEVDKLGMDFRGDPSSALLEVLDPEQNFSFSDHYLETPFDLSKVMFITTANVLDTIPPPLRDRMEVMDLPGYTMEEKATIARKFLIPRQLEGHGLTSQNLSINAKALQKIAKDYTREAGVRNLERQIATICRAVASKVASGETEKVTVTPSMIEDYLGPARFYSEVAERTAQAGVATGLAWTAGGGDILFIEATKMPGRKSLTLTGQLGDVMKESAQAALSYVRSKADDLRINPDFFDKYDIHVHVPQGAIPKDGPSAGVTMCTALISLLTERPIRNDVAMTGEITLRGMVLPVGGIKEKVLAAHRAGIRNVILPAKNRRDIEDIPENIRSEMEFRFARRIDDIVPWVFRLVKPTPKVADEDHMEAKAASPEED